MWTGGDVPVTPAYSRPFALPADSIVSPHERLSRVRLIHHDGHPHGVRTPADLTPSSRTALAASSALRLPDPTRRRRIGWPVALSVLLHIAFLALAIVAALHKRVMPQATPPASVAMVFESGGKAPPSIANPAPLSPNQQASPAPQPSEPPPPMPPAAHAARSTGRTDAADAPGRTAATDLATGSGPAGARDRPTGADGRSADAGSRPTGSRCAGARPADPHPSGPHPAGTNAAGHAAASA